MTYDMPPLPRFLDRKRWTKRDHDKAGRTWSAMIERNRKEREALEAQRAAEKAAKAEQLAQEEIKRNERLKVLKARAVKKAGKQKAQNVAMNLAMDNGTVTVYQLTKALPDDLKKFARWAVRDAFKRGLLKRKGKKVYTL